MSEKGRILDDQHWTYANYRQRILSKDWRKILLNDDDTVIFQGRVMRLVGRSMGSGVVEVSKGTANGAVI